MMEDRSKFYTYEVSFILDQRGDYIEWLVDALESGLRDEEAIYELVIRQIPEHEMEVH
jgi:hypothetical protein